MFLVPALLAGVALLAADARAAQSAAVTNPPVARSVTRAADDLFPDPVIAKGKGFEIKRSKFDNSMAAIRANFAAQKQAVPAVVEQQVLDRLIQIQLLYAKATAADRAAGAEITSNKIDTIVARNGGEVALERQLKALGSTKAELRANLNEETTATLVLERELKVNVTDDQVKKYYEDNPAKFEQPEMVRASHILLSTRDQAGTEFSAEVKTAKRKQAEALLKRARDGEDFARLVEQYSEDPGSKDRGGEYTFPRASADPQHAMVPEFEAAAFALKTNQISDIVTTAFGYHIIKLNEKIPAKKLEFAKVATDIREYLKEQQVVKERQQEYQDYISKIKKDAGVEILDPALKPKEAPRLSSSAPPIPSTPEPSAATTPATQSTNNQP